MLSNPLPLIMHAAANVDHDLLGSPAYTWQTGQFNATITDNGSGDLTHNLGADYAIDSAQELPQFTRNGAVAASGSATFGYASASDTTKRVTVAQEAALGGASTLADIDYWMIIWKLIPRS